MSNENPATTPAPTYDASSIQVLEGLEAVRKRPSMYIGSTDYKGLHHLVYEVVDNSIDEALAGYCNNIEVSINENGSVTVTDDGRGIPVEMHEKYKKPALEIVMTMLHAGGKFDNRTYKVSGGLHGVGVSVVNALSRFLDVEVSRNGKIYFQRYERGKPVEEVKIIGDSSHTGTKTTFMPDNAIFETLEFQYDILANRLRELAYLNKGIRIMLADKKSGKAQEFHYEGGIIQFIEYLNEGKNVLHPRPIYFEREKDTTKVEIAMQYNDGYNEVVLAFANNINTHEGGTHLSGFRAALTRSVNDYAKKNNLVKGDMVLSGEDIREGLTAIISVKLTNPQFEGQTKTKLGNSDVKGIVETLVADGLNDYLEENPSDARKIIEKTVMAFQAQGSGPQSPGADPSQVGAGELDAARQAGGLPGTGPEQVRALHRGRRLGRRLGQAGPRSQKPGDTSAARQNIERREGEAEQDPAERRDQGTDHRFRHRRRGGFRPRQGQVPQDHTDDRCGRRRRAHTDAAADFLLPVHAAAGGSGLCIHRPATSLPGEEGEGGALRLQREGAGHGHGRDGPDRCGHPALQRPGRDEPGSVMVDHHGPGKAHRAASDAG